MSTTPQEAANNPKTEAPQKSASTSDMKPPTGIDLQPQPPRTTRLRRQVGWIIFGSLIVVTVVVVYSVYTRPGAFAHSPLANARPNLEPATRTANEITKDIPPGVMNLAEDANKGPKDATTASPALSEKGSASADGKRSALPASPMRPAPPELRVPPRIVTPGSSERANTMAMPPTLYAPSYRAPTPGPVASPKPPAPDPRLVAAYERELQAIAAPTTIQGENGPNPIASTPSPVPTGNASSLNALANALGRMPEAPNGTERSIVVNRAPEENPPSSNEAFLSGARRQPSSDYLNSTRMMPLSKYEIKAGWEIPAVLEQEINSDLPGELKALVTANVYDTATGRYLLIPQGSRLIGTYNANISYAQQRLQVIWSRLIFPDASWIDLGGMVGQDAHGSSGFSDQVDHHYERLVGFAVLSSVFSAGVQLSQPRTGNVLETPSVGQIAAGAVGQQAGQLGSEITRRNLNVPPTIKAPIGYKFNVRVNRDILFESPYEAR